MEDSGDARISIEKSSLAAGGVVMKDGDTGEARKSNEKKSATDEDVYKTAIAESFLALDPVPPACITKTSISGVDGAFLLKNVLSTEECRRIAVSVQELVQNKLLELSEKTILERRRRNSQHHTPLKVRSEDLDILCKRLKPYVIVLSEDWCVCLGLEDYYSIMLLSYSISSGALEIPDLLLPYSY